MEWVWALMIVAIVAIATWGKTQREKNKRAGSDGGVTDQDAVRMRDEMKALRERVAVLERLATENHGRLSLDREIEQLRGEPDR